MKRLLLAPVMLSILGLIGCSSPQAGINEPIGDNREHWEWLNQKCDENMERRYAGYMGEFDRSYCMEMEIMRERITGIENSSAPGAMDF